MRPSLQPTPTTGRPGLQRLDETPSAAPEQTRATLPPSRPDTEPAAKRHAGPREREGAAHRLGLVTSSRPSAPSTDEIASASSPRKRSLDCARFEAVIHETAAHQSAPLSRALVGAFGGLADRGITPDKFQGRPGTQILQDMGRHWAGLPASEQATGEYRTILEIAFDLPSPHDQQDLRAYVEEGLNSFPGWKDRLAQALFSASGTGAGAQAATQVPAQVPPWQAPLPGPAAQPAAPADSGDSLSNLLALMAAEGSGSPTGHAARAAGGTGRDGPLTTALGRDPSSPATPLSQRRFPFFDGSPGEPSQGAAAATSRLRLDRTGTPPAGTAAAAAAGTSGTAAAATAAAPRLSDRVGTAPGSLTAAGVQGRPLQILEAALERRFLTPRAAADLLANATPQTLVDAIRFLVGHALDPASDTTGPGADSSSESDGDGGMGRVRPASSADVDTASGAQPSILPPPPAPVVPTPRMPWSE